MLLSKLLSNYFELSGAVSISFSNIDAMLFQGLIKSNIKILNLSFNGLRDVECLQNAVNLQFLNINFNEIESLAGLAKCERLREIHAKENKIVWVHSSITKLRALTMIDFENNLIECFETVATLAANLKLELLNLTGNPITKRQSYRKNIVKILPNIKGIDLNDNQVSKREGGGEDDKEFGFTNINFLNEYSISFY